MGSKIFLLLGLSIALVLLIGSEVAARDLAETTTKTEGATLDGGSHHGGGGCRHYCHGKCCSAAEEASLDGYNGGGGSHHGGGGSHHGGGGGYNGGGSHHGGGGGCKHYCHGRCCSAAEALEATQVKPQN